MTRHLTIAVDQLSRPQPGGIGTYVRSLLSGLASLHDESFDVTGLAAKGSFPSDVRATLAGLATAPFGVALTTRLWSRWPVGVPANADVVHATSMAGPFSGGRRSAVHSVALHDLLWRDVAGASTRRGVAFHESRLRWLARHEAVRVFTSSPGLDERLVAEGFDRSRLHRVQLGVDDDATRPASRDEVATHLAAYGVTGPFTFYAGTREPRKNLAALVRAHRDARRDAPELGPLVIAGPPGWGEVDVADAVVLGSLDRALLKGLFRDAAVVAYVPLAEGWGLPPLEALHAGTRVVASTTTPSVERNPEVVRVDPKDLAAMSGALVRAVALADDDVARQARQASVAHLTWQNCAREHLAGWS